MFALYASVIGISLTLSYAFWVRVRVLRLQQDIYDIRDELFDEACRLEAHDDPAYCQTRQFLNGLAGSAADLSVPAMIYLVSQSPSPPLGDWKPTTNNAELQVAIDKSIHASARRIVFYLSHETLTGVAIWMLIAIPFASIGTRESVVDKQAEILVEKGLGRSGIGLGGCVAA